MKDSYLLFIAFSGHCYAYTGMETWRARRPAEPGILFMVVPGLPDQLLLTWAPLSLKSGALSQVKEATLIGYLEDDKKLRPYYRQKKKCRVVLSRYVYFWLLDEARLRMGLRRHKVRRWLRYSRRKIRRVACE